MDDFALRFSCMGESLLTKSCQGLLSNLNLATVVVLKTTCSSLPLPRGQASTISCGFKARLTTINGPWHKLFLSRIYLSRIAKWQVKKSLPKTYNKTNADWQDGAIASPQDYEMNPKVLKVCRFRMDCYELPRANLFPDPRRD